MDAARHAAGARGIREMQWYFDREDFAIVYKHSDKTIERLRDAHGKLIRRGHAYQRHGLDRVAAKADQTDPKPCEHCGKLRPVMLAMAGGNEHGEWWLCSYCWRNATTENAPQIEERDQP